VGKIKATKLIILWKTLWMMRTLAGMQLERAYEKTFLPPFGVANPMFLSWLTVTTK
jgi:hypothetical protein